MSDHGRGGDAWNKGRFPDAKGVEVQVDTNEVLVRHSGDPEEVLRFTPGEWTEFLRAVKGGEFD